MRCWVSCSFFRCLMENLLVILRDFCLSKAFVSLEKKKHDQTMEIADFVKDDCSSPSPNCVIFH